MTLADSIKDNGMKSRKFVLTILSLTLVLAGALFLPEAIYPIYISGILGVLGIFIGGNVGNKLAAGKVESWTTNSLTQTTQEATMVINKQASQALSDDDLTKGD